jgi:hypothetical protein
MFSGPVRSQAAITSSLNRRSCRFLKIRWASVSRAVAEMLRGRLPVYWSHRVLSLLIDAT